MSVKLTSAGTFEWEEGDSEVLPYTFADISDRTWRGLDPLPQNLEPMLAEGFRPEQFRTLINEGEKEACIENLGLMVTQFYREILRPGEHIVAVPVMTGAKYVSSALTQKIRVPMRIDTMKVDSYGGGTKSKGVIHIHKDMNSVARDRHVLLIEDIVDTANTIRYLRNHITMSQFPASITVATLLTKHDAQVYDTPVEFSGFETPANAFVVGYGLDIDHKMRNLPVVAVYNEKGKRKKK